jgi:hypothetical protein
MRRDGHTAEERAIMFVQSDSREALREIADIMADAAETDLGYPFAIVGKAMEQLDATSRVVMLAALYQAAMSFAADEWRPTFPTTIDG